MWLLNLGFAGSGVVSADSTIGPVFLMDFGNISNPVSSAIFDTIAASSLIEDGYTIRKAFSTDAAKVSSEIFDDFPVTGAIE